MKIKLICGGESLGVPLPFLDRVSGGVTYFSTFIQPNAHTGYQSMVVDTGGGLGVFGFETDYVNLDLPEEETTKWYSLHGTNVHVSVDASFVTGGDNPISVKISKWDNGQEHALNFTANCLPGSYIFSSEKIDFNCELLQMEE